MSEAKIIHGDRIPLGVFFASLTPTERCRWFQWADIKGGMDDGGLFPELVERFRASLIVQTELF